MNDPITEVWTFAKPLIAAGKISEAFVCDLMNDGLRFKPRWAEKMKEVIYNQATRPPYPWQARMQQLGLTDVSELSLYDALLRGECHISKLRKLYSPQGQLLAIITRWEVLGWLEVKRGRNGQLLKISCTSTLPCLLEPGSGLH